MSGANLELKNPISTCGNCGYPTLGMSSFECPECGSDIREVGVKVPGVNDLQGIPLYVALLWSVGMLVFTIYLANQLPQIIPNQQRYEYEANLTPTSNLMLSIGVSYQEVLSHPKLRGAGGGETVSGFPSYEIELGRTQGNARLYSLVFDLSDQTTSSSTRSHQLMSIEIHDRSFSHNDASGQRVSGTGTPTQQDFIAWLVGCGLKPTDPETAAIASDLLLYTQALLANRNQVTLMTMQSTGYRLSYGTQREYLWKVGFFVACFLVWVLGLRRLEKNPNKNRKNIQQTP